MTKRRVTIALFALVGAIIGAALGMFAVPSSSQYKSTANVALVPAADLSTAEASSFWEVLTRGQVSRTAAILYGDWRWLIPAAEATKVRPNQLRLTAAALPETTMMAVTVTANSKETAETALNAVLTAATPEVSSLVAPYFVKVLWPPKDNAYKVPGPGKTQLGAAGGLGGLLVAGGIGWVAERRRLRRELAVPDAPELVDEEIPPR